MGIYTEAVQKLYVAYFSRPGDVAGLTYWEGVVAKMGGSTAAVSAAFAASDEYKASFAGQSEYQVINTIYMNLFGRQAEPAALAFWGQGLINGNFTIDNAVTAIAAGAQNADLTAYNNKVAAATAFTAALDTSSEILGYDGAVANAAAKTWLAGVTTNATLTTAIEPAALNATVTTVTTPFVPPVNVTLTTGVDAFTGSAGNDVITATTAAGAMALTTFDVIDAGAGTDTIRFLDTAAQATDLFSLPTDAAVSNVEVVNVATTGGLNLNTTSWTGVAAINATASGTAAVAVTAAGTTDITVGSATTGVAGTTTISGGRNVNAILTDAAAGDVSVTGAALTNVTIKGGAVATVDNTSATGTTAAGKTLTNVTLDGVNGATAALKGAALTNVSLKNIDQATTVTVTNDTAAHALNLSLDNVGYNAAGGVVAGVIVTDAKASTVNVASNTKSNVAVNAAVAKTVNVTGTAALVLDVANVAAATSINASAATGGVTLTGIAAGVTSITTGAGKDVFTVTAATTADNTTTSTDETVNATVDSGAGDDTITIATTGTGKVTIAAGAGNDKVTIASRDTEVLSIDLGDGNDTLDAASTTAITATDVINAGAGTDTLALKLVGSANIGAFAGFDLFDAAGLNRTLDVDILTTKNTVSEIVASADVGTAELTNVGAGVGVRVTGDMANSVLRIDQKTAGALTVTVDADETGTGDTAIDTLTSAVNALDATSLKAVFDTSFLANVTGEITAGDNIATLNLTGGAATSLEIVSGGALANNVLNFTDAATNKLASVTISGTNDLTLDIATPSTSLNSVNASALTGDLTFSTADLKDGGSVTLGSGADRITVAATGTANESIVGFEKASATAVSADATADAKAAAIADADMLSFGAGITVATASTAAAGGTVNAKGVLSFTGAGPSTLAAAVLIADAAAETAGEAVVFQYLNDSYVFVQGTTDIVVKLTGITGVTNLVEDGATDQFFLV